MIKTSDNQRKVLDYAQQHGPFRPRDVAEFGVHPEDISRLCRKGLLSRVGRGLYELADNEPSTNQTLVEACKRVGQGVVCLLSALRFHEIGTQLPHKVWLAIPSKAARPRIEYPPVELTYLTERMYCEGIEEHRTGGGVVRVYSVAKTLVDCFRFRNRVGVDVAVEALREVVTHRRRYGVTIGQISEVARKCRVGEVVRPYLEALIAWCRMPGDLDVCQRPLRRVGGRDDGDARSFFDQGHDFFSCVLKGHQSLFLLTFGAVGLSQALSTVAVYREAGWIARGRRPALLPPGPR